MDGVCDISIFCLRPERSLIENPEMRVDTLVAVVRHGSGRFHGSRWCQVGPPIPSVRSSQGVAALSRPAARRGVASCFLNVT
jgi:hypothetical protein